MLPEAYGKPDQAVPARSLNSLAPRAPPLSHPQAQPSSPRTVNLRRANFWKISQGSPLDLLMKKIQNKPPNFADAAAILKKYRCPTAPKFRRRIPAPLKNQKKADTTGIFDS